MSQAVAVSVPHLRSGLADWLRSYSVLLRWEVSGLRLHLPVLACVEVLTGVGLVLGYGLFFHGPPPSTSVLYLSTGVPVITLYVVGLVFVPQVVSQERIAHTFDYVQSMAVPRSVRFAAWYSLDLLCGVPGMVAALVAAALRFGVPLIVTPALVPAVLLVCLCATGLGYAIGHALRLPGLINVLVQTLNFYVFGFAAVTFPPSQLPGWLASVNRGLPFESMGTVTRAALGAGTPGESVVLAYLVLAAWTGVAILVAAAAISRRG
jgi:ABC-2 type transport system permease protein